MKKIIALALLMAGVTAMEAGNRIIEENIIQTDKKNIEMEDLELTKEWDKIFPKSYKVNHSKEHFATATASRLQPICIHQRI